MGRYFKHPLNLQDPPSPHGAPPADDRAPERRRRRFHGIRPIVWILALIGAGTVLLWLYRLVVIVLVYLGGTST